MEAYNYLQTRRSMRNVIKQLQTRCFGIAGADSGKEAFTTSSIWKRVGRRRGDREGEPGDPGDPGTGKAQTKTEASQQWGCGTWRASRGPGWRDRQCQIVWPPPGTGSCGHQESPKGQKWLKGAAGRSVSKSQPELSVKRLMWQQGGVCGGKEVLGDLEVLGPAWGRWGGEEGKQGSGSLCPVSGTGTAATGMETGWRVQVTCQGLSPHQAHTEEGEKGRGASDTRDCPRPQVLPEWCLQRETLFVSGWASQWRACASATGETWTSPEQPGTAWETSEPQCWSCRDKARRVRPHKCGRRPLPWPLWMPHSQGPVPFI